MGLMLKLLGLLLLQLFSVGILIVEEEYLMFICVMILVLTSSVILIDLLKNWLDDRRVEILLESRRLNQKVLLALGQLLKANKSKQNVRFELLQLMVLEKKKKLQARLDLETLYGHKKRGSLLRCLASGK